MTLHTRPCMNVTTVKVGRQGQLKYTRNLLYTRKQTFKLCLGLFSILCYFITVLLQKI